MAGPIVVAPVPGGANIPAIVQQAVQAFQQVQGQPLPPPAAMPLASIVAIEILGQDPGRRRPLTAAGTGVVTAWEQRAGALRRFSVVRGDGQIGRPGAVLPVQPRLRVTNLLGQPLENVAVVFRLEAADGNLGGLQVRQVQTDPAGEATCGDWTLGANAGLKTLAARVNQRRVVTFRAVAV